MPGCEKVPVSFPAKCYILGQWLPKPPLLTPFLTPVAPRRARDRVPSILALGLFLPVSDFTQPENGLPTPPLSHIPIVTKPQVTVQKRHPSISALLAARCR